jgi:hypothetical protein
MFVRIRKSARRVQFSLVETHRDGGGVRHSHIASLGAVPLDGDAAERGDFWQRLGDRLERLSNRIDEALKAKILAAVCAHVPQPSADESAAAQRERTQRAAFRDLAWTDAHIKHCRLMAVLNEDEFERYLKFATQPAARARREYAQLRRFVRAEIKRQRQQHPPNSES